MAITRKIHRCTNDVINYLVKYETIRSVKHNIIIYKLLCCSLTE